MKEGLTPAQAADHARSRDTGEYVERVVRGLAKYGIAAWYEDTGPASVRLFASRESEGRETRLTFALHAINDTTAESEHGVAYFTGDWVARIRQAFERKAR